MNEKNMTQIKESIIMPPEMADTLLQSCTQNRPKPYRYSRYSKLCAVLITAFCICAAGSTSLAAYNIYQEKQLAVFMDYDLTQEEITAVGDALAQIPGIKLRYISGDAAWEEFKAEYLTGDADLAQQIKSLGNPLSQSFNYEVSVRLDTDTEAVREQIGRIDGVRRITTKRELQKAE